MPTSVSMRTHVQIGTQNGESLRSLTAASTESTSRTQPQQAANTTAPGQAGESGKTTGAAGGGLAGRAIRQVAVGTGWFFKAAGEILVTNIAGGALTFLMGCYANSWLSYAGVPTGSLMEGGLHALLTYKIPDMLEQGGRRMMQWLRGTAPQDPLLQQMERDNEALRAERAELRRSLRQDTAYRAQIMVTESRQPADGSEQLADSQRPSADPQQDAEASGRGRRKTRGDVGEFPPPQSPSTRGRSTRSSPAGRS